MSHAPQRGQPRIWWHDWLPLRGLVNAIRTLIKQRGLLVARAVVVDFGCGDKPYRELFSPYIQRYVCCDLDGAVDVVITPGQPLALADGSADGIVSFQVLEHVWDIDWYLRECHRILKPGGWLLLSTHGTWLFHPHPTDFRRWTRPGLEQEISSRGFVNDETLAICGPLAWTLTFRLIAYREALRRIPVIGLLLFAPIAVLLNLRGLVEDALTPAPIRNTNASIYLTLSRKPG